ncbi:tetratricopeptide repeat protein [Candidatus Protochlamydia phocaeensis]|uniref:tetratricopeptide repeat protein n=1 Tax=Candidatus Protochlamydia phocaeensis TaxID=1414722 RepID=UPI000837B3D3|nr:tetratricopeptide repeat protein [Candidatus Protochlamydia phocaeensis]
MHPVSSNQPVGLEQSAVNSELAELKKENQALKRKIEKLKAMFTSRPEEEKKPSSLKKRRVESENALLCLAPNLADNLGNIEIISYDDNQKPLSFIVPKFILAAISTVYRSVMFSKNWSQEERISWEKEPNVPFHPQAIAKVLQFAFQKINPALEQKLFVDFQASEENFDVLEDIILLSDRYLMDRVFEACQKVIEEQTAAHLQSMVNCFTFIFNLPGELEIKFFPSWIKGVEAYRKKNGNHAELLSIFIHLNKSCTAEGRKKEKVFICLLNAIRNTIAYLNKDSSLEEVEAACQAIVEFGYFNFNLNHSVIQSVAQFYFEQDISEVFFEKAPFTYFFYLSFLIQNKRGPEISEKIDLLLKKCGWEDLGLILKSEHYKDSNRIEAIKYTNQALAYNRKETVHTLRALIFLMDQNFDQALEESNLALQINACNSGALAYRGICYQKKREKGLALIDFTRALYIHAHNASALMHRGGYFKCDNQWDLAIADFDRYLQIQPNDYSVLTLRGSCYRSKGNFERGLADFNQLVSLYPDDGQALIKRGECYQLMGELELAYADFNKAVEVEPENNIALIKRGLFYKKLDNLDLAIADFNQVLERNPDDAMALAYRGQCYRLSDNRVAAMEDFNHLLRINPSNAFALAERGICYKLEGLFDLALEDFNTALQINPNDTFALTERGDCYKLKNEIDLALADWEQVLRINPKDSFALAYRGVCHFQQGHLAEARADLDQALEINPHNSLANEYKARLE